MLSMWHLLWIIPVTALISILGYMLMVAVRQKGKRLSKKNTNARRIQTQSIEELGADIHAFSLGMTPWCDYHCKNRGDDGCDKCIQKWLQAEVKEDGLC